MQSLMLEAGWNITPTQFQQVLSTEWQSRTCVIHDGIDTQLAAPDPYVPPCFLMVRLSHMAVGYHVC